jgi:hypothetical protein
MPKYLNSNTYPVTIGANRIEPGATLVTLDWLGVLPSGITETAATPYINPIIYSTKLASTTTVLVPNSYIDPITNKTINLVGNYKIKAYVGTGDCFLQFNTGDAVAINLGLYQTYEFMCSTRTVNTIIVTISSGTVYLSIEKI